MYQWIKPRSFIIRLAHSRADGRLDPAAVHTDQAARIEGSIQVKQGILEISELGFSSKHWSVLKDCLEYGKR